MQWSKGSGGLYHNGPPKPRALIIDGQALNIALAEPCRRPLAAFAMECAAVVCCRVSPDQKREVRRRHILYWIIGQRRYASWIVDFSGYSAVLCCSVLG